MQNKSNTPAGYSSKQIFFESEKDVRIHGQIYLPVLAPRIGLVLYHGGQAGSSKRFEFLQPILAENGIASLAIDFRGKGQSSGTYERSTLDERLVDARAAIEFFTKYLDKIQIGILGVSLGGDTVRLLEEFSEIKTIILIGPVAVSHNLTHVSPPHKAHSLSKKTDTWKDSKAFPLLKSFQGSKLVIYGDKEDAAKPEIIEEFRKAVRDTGKFVVLKNTGHNPFLVDREATEVIRKEQISARKRTVDVIIQFLKETS